MTALDRRAFVAAGCNQHRRHPQAARAKECPAAGMSWMTMSLEARNLAFNNVAHVGPEVAQQKTEGWAAASKALREQHPKHLDLAYAPGERTNGISIRPPTPRRRASSTSMAATGSAAARRPSPASPRVSWRIAGRRRCRATRSPPRRA